ncbi:pilus assembly protein PilM [Paenibacillus sp. PL2-23]|uniref:pilus assembly protein PilM n=1 Tax=Paenibacillus sp. PL2-23 TaxID=2100729 RepID=UPI0030FA9639
MFASADRVGLTIDQHGIHYAKLKKKKEWEIDKCGFMPFEPGWYQDDQFIAIDEIRHRLLAWVRSEKLTGAAVILTVPTSQVIIRKLTFEASNAKELKQLVELEVETALHLPFQTPVYDFIHTETMNGKQSVLVYASPLKWIQQCVSLLEDAGLKVTEAELASTSLARAIQDKLDTPLESTMLVNLNQTTIEIYMFHKGNPVFMRVMNEYDQLAIGEEGLSQELIGSINAEISRLLSFYQYSIHEGESRITHTIITGDLGGRDRFQTEFSELHPEMEVGYADFAYIGQSMPDILADPYRIPFGLALREKKTTAINLLPERTISKRRAPIQIVVAGSIWIACLIAMASLMAMNHASLESHKQQAESLRQSNALLEQELANLNQQSRADADPEAVIQTILDNRQDTVEVLDDLNDELPAGASLQTLEYSKPGSVALLITICRMWRIT